MLVGQTLLVVHGARPPGDGEMALSRTCLRTKGAVVMLLEELPGQISHDTQALHLLDMASCRARPAVSRRRSAAGRGSVVERCLFPAREDTRSMMIWTIGSCSGSRRLTIPVLLGEALIDIEPALSNVMLSAAGCITST